MARLKDIRGGHRGGKEEKEGVLASNTKHMKHFMWEYEQISQDFSVFLNMTYPRVQTKRIRKGLPVNKFYGQ